MTDYCYLTKPFKHQHDIFMDARDRDYYALLLEQGCGKTKIIIDNAAYLYANGKIDALLVVAPNGVTRNWVVNEIPIHCPEYVNAKSAWYSSSPNKKEEDSLRQVLENQGLRIITINIEALATVNGVAFVKKFLLSFRTMFVIDESTTIKNPKAIRTKNLLKLKLLAKYRRIMTGTPITQGPTDAYTQFAFLDSTILRCESYFAFRNTYCVMKEMRTAGRSFQVIQGYQNMDKLTQLIAPYSYRVTKQDCLDLPPKLYVKRYVELSKVQRSLYNSLKKEVLVEFNGKEMSAPLALTKLMRLQQIVGGFFSPDIEFDFDAEGNLLPTTMARTSEPIDEKNLRVESLIELLEETDGKVIIWARFRAEIEAIVCAIKKIWEDKNNVVEYHGGIDNQVRSEAVRLFQENPETRFFVGHVQAGGKGLTLTAASTTVYYSNNFSLEDRLQSEDRNHRIGTRNSVTYVDMVAPNTLDEKVVATLRDKKSVADLITGDTPVEEWI